jgi:pyruvate/2-oxoacid:ferredoxin oxidoreductase alpha subunit
MSALMASFSNPASVARYVEGPPRFVPGFADLHRMSGILLAERAPANARVLVLGWGSTYGPIGAACRRVRQAGDHVAQLHLRHLNPFPRDLGEILERYETVLIPEMNLGQLALLVRGRYLVDAVGYNQVNGMPLKAADLAQAINTLIDGVEHPAPAADKEVSR